MDCERRQPAGGSVTEFGRASSAPTEQSPSSFPLWAAMEEPRPPVSRTSSRDSASHRSQLAFPSKPAWTSKRSACLATSIPSSSAEPRSKPMRLSLSNRIKPHTDFFGKLGSGIQKMPQHPIHCGPRA